MQGNSHLNNDLYCTPLVWHGVWSQYADGRHPPIWGLEAYKGGRIQGGGWPLQGGEDSSERSRGNTCWTRGRHWPILLLRLSSYFSFVPHIWDAIASACEGFNQFSVLNNISLLCSFLSDDKLSSQKIMCLVWRVTKVANEGVNDRLLVIALGDNRRIITQDVADTSSEALELHKTALPRTLVLI